MKLLLYLAIGGTLGTWSRYAIQGLVQPASGAFPVGTLVVNLVGAFVLGFLMRFLLGSTAAATRLL